MGEKTNLKSGDHVNMPKDRNRKLLTFSMLALAAEAVRLVPRALNSRTISSRPRSCWTCWTGETAVTVEVPDVPAAVLYREYADLSRMTEWSPLLESVAVDPLSPSRSVWVMRVPRGLKVAARILGYPECLSWEAELEAPGPPSMNWTSVLDATGRLKGLPNAAFEPSGSLSVTPLHSGVTSMTLTLRYALPDPTPGWTTALVQSPPVQLVLRNRMSAGMERFAAAMRREWYESCSANAEVAQAEVVATNGQYKQDTCGSRP